MSTEPAQEPVTEPIGAEPQEPTTTAPTLEEVMEQNRILSENLEKRTNELKGTDKALGDFKKQFSEFREQHETEKQRAERILKEKEEEQEKERTSFYTDKSTFEKERNEWEVQKKAFDLGFTKEDIEALSFTTIESVEKAKNYLDAKLLSTKEATAKNILDSHSGKPEGYNNIKNNVDTSFLNGCKA